MGEPMARIKVVELDGAEMTRIIDPNLTAKLV
jgi:hypothetical protein